LWLQPCGVVTLHDRPIHLRTQNKPRQLPLRSLQIQRQAPSLLQCDCSIYFKKSCNSVFPSEGDYPGAVAATTGQLWRRWRGPCRPLSYMCLGVHVETTYECRGILGLHGVETGRFMGSVHDFTGTSDLHVTTNILAIRISSATLDSSPQMCSFGYSTIRKCL
jgi:hypothetical protein